MVNEERTKKRDMRDVQSSRNGRLEGVMEGERKRGREGRRMRGRERLAKV